jgi:hypothetical protein
LSLSDQAACMRDLHRLLTEDGLAGVPVLTTSAVSPGGAAELHEFLVSTVAAHRARTARLGADLDRMAARVVPLVPQRGSDPALRDGERALRNAFAAAAGVPAVVDATGRAYERRALATMGWPPLRWVGKLRPDPLRRLGVGSSSSQPGLLRRTSLPSSSAPSRAAADSAVRALADTASAGLPAPWPRKLLEAAKLRATDVPDALDRVVGGADLGMDRRPRWWLVVAAIQWVVLGAALVGGLWLGLIAVLAYLQIDLDPPALGPFAWPTVLLAAGLAAGLLLRVVIRPVVAFGAARRRRQVTSELLQRVETVAEDFVLAPLRQELCVYGQLSTAAQGLSR